jgi:hypothetical protein
MMKWINGCAVAGIVGTVGVAAGAQTVKPVAAPAAGATRDQGAAGAKATLTHNLMVNGKPVGGDVEPTVVNGTVMVPIRFITQYLGGAVDWSPKGERVEISRGSRRSIVLNIGSTRAMVNGSPSALARAPIVLHGRTFIPLREVARFFDAQVSYSPDSHTVSVTLPESATAPGGV